MPGIFNYQQPQITSVTPLSYDSQGGVTVSITGTSFSLSAVTRIGPFVCPLLQAQTHQLITCQLPPGQGANLSVVITTSTGQTSTPPVLFSYNPPNITSISPSGGKSGTNVYITLTGTSFGASGGVVYLGAGKCNTASGVYQHQVVNCLVPDGAGANLPVYIVVGNQTSNTVFFSYAPVLTSVTVIVGTANTQGGATLLISGFGFSIPSKAVASVMVSSSSCTVTSQNDTVVLCTLPPGQGVSNGVVLSVAGQSSNSINFAYLPPVITSIWPNNGTTIGGSLVTILGTSFGLPGAATVSVGGAPCAVIAAQSNVTRVVCTLPPGTGAAQSVVLSAGGQSSNTLLFSYFPPVIDRIFPKNGDAAGGYSVTLYGSNFGAVRHTKHAGTHTRAAASLNLLERTVLMFICAACSCVLLRSAFFFLFFSSLSGDRERQRPCGCFFGVFDLPQRQCCHSDHSRRFRFVESAHVRHVATVKHCDLHL
jgi:hypothetical protein